VKPHPKPNAQAGRSGVNTFAVSDIIRFWQKVTSSLDLNACWEWQASRTRRGYGSFNLNGKMVQAHRFALEQALGRPLEPGECACHSCDNPPCCNPLHLWAGTVADNNRDARRKGRTARGERHGARMREVAARGERNGTHTKPESVARGDRVGFAKLTEEKVIAIMARWLKGDETQVRLADEFGVHKHTIGNIVRGKTWQHVFADHQAVV
jgi:hypothetical protein